MNTLSDIRTAIQTDLNVDSSASLFTPTTIDSAINRAYIKCARLFRFPQLEDAKCTTTQANVEYYDIPSTWTPDSVFLLQIGSDYYGDEPDYSPMTFEDYLSWKADTDNSSSTDKKWAVHGNQYFIYPTPTASALVISIWGQKNITALTLDADTTIFTYNMPECNEAILEEAKAMLKHKGEDDKGGQFFSSKALTTLSVAFNKLKQEKAKEEKENPMLQVFDMFGRAQPSEYIGRFA